MKMVEQKIYNPHPQPNYQTFWILVVLATLASICGIWLTRIYLMDDALITLRYSFNFARLGIPIWNQADLGNPSMGYTSILWMGLNTIPALFISNKDILILIAQGFSFAALLLIIVVLCRDVNDLMISTSMKILIVLLVFTQFGYGLHVNSAMETMLFSSLVLLTVRSYGKGQHIQSYIFGVLSFLVRPEGLLVCAMVFAMDLIYRRYRRFLIAGIAFALILAGLYIVLTHWYGDFLPNTFYAKQGLYNPVALKRTIFFLFTIALPFLLLSIHAAFSLRNRISLFMLISALIYFLYYLSVNPFMNVMSRYQWPGLVLLTFASLPSFEYLIQNFQKYKLVALALLLIVLGLNTGNALGASYFGNATGSAEQNLIRIGKTMFSYRQPGGWLIYHDAGAVCYFSDWNTHETIGLTNGPLARGKIAIKDIYLSPDSVILLQNFDLTVQDRVEAKKAFTDMISGYGFHYIQDIPILYVEGQRNFVISLYSKDIGLANVILAHLSLEKDIKPNLSFTLYRIAKELVAR